MTMNSVRYLVGWLQLHEVLLLFREALKSGSWFADMAPRGDNSWFQAMGIRIPNLRMCDIAVVVNCGHGQVNKRKSILSNN